MDDFVGSPKPHAKRKLSALQRSSHARQRMRIIREEAHTLPVPTPPSLGAGLRPSSLDVFAIYDNNIFTQPLNDNN